MIRFEFVYPSVKYVSFLRMGSKTGQHCQILRHLNRMMQKKTSCQNIVDEVNFWYERTIYTQTMKNTDYISKTSVNSGRIQSSPHALSLTYFVLYDDDMMY